MIYYAHSPQGTLLPEAVNEIPFTYNPSSAPLGNYEMTTNENDLIDVLENKLETLDFGYHLLVFNQFPNNINKVTI